MQYFSYTTQDLPVQHRIGLADDIIYVPSYMWLSWLSLVMFFPIGIFSVRYHYISSQQKNNGYRKEARKTALKSKWYAITAIICFILLVNTLVALRLLNIVKFSFTPPFIEVY